ncbi:Integral membrane protein OS=Streptomyces tendae OX=1932 GN=GUR47_13980 PE=4 SV=1 [Streptomyces tendae]
MPRARHEGRLWLRTVLAAAVACALLQGAVRYVGDDGDVSSLRSFQWTALRAAGIHGLIALTYLIRPKKAPADPPQPVAGPREREVHR